MICTCCCETWCIVKRNKSLSKLGITEYFRYKNRMKIVDLAWPQSVGEGGIVFLTWYFDHLRIINFIWAVEEWSASLRPVSDHHPPPPTRLSSHLPPTATKITPYCHKIGGNRLAIDKVFTKVDRSKWKIPELPKYSLQPIRVVSSWLIYMILLLNTFMLICPFTKKREMRSCCPDRLIRYTLDRIVTVELIKFR